MSSFAVSSDGVKVSKDHPFLLDKHVAYISMISADRESFEYVASQHFRMSGVYWGITAMSLLGKDLKEAMNTEEIITWVMQCQHESGG
jgi:geranylgeranyl transferase type-2 subunit beta